MKPVRHGIAVCLWVSALLLCLPGCDPDTAQQQVSASAAQAKLPALILIPAGSALIGSIPPASPSSTAEVGLIKPPYQDEAPQHLADVPAFYLDRTETDLAAFRGWLKQRYGRLAAPWNGPEPDDFPVTQVSWHQAQTYCHAHNGRLPTETEWEKAARGSKGHIFPWGNGWQADNTNHSGNEHGSRLPVGSTAGDRSPYGVMDMAGNVSEWVSDWYHPYPGSHYHSPDFGRRYKMIKGGSASEGHYALSYFFRPALRAYLPAETQNAEIGFRCAYPVAP